MLELEGCVLSSTLFLKTSMKGHFVPSSVMHSSVSQSSRNFHLNVRLQKDNAEKLYYRVQKEKEKEKDSFLIWLASEFSRHFQLDMLFSTAWRHVRKPLSSFDVFSSMSIVFLPRHGFILEASIVRLLSQYTCLCTQIHVNMWWNMYIFHMLVNFYLYEIIWKLGEGLVLLKSSFYKQSQCCYRGVEILVTTLL